MPGRRNYDLRSGRVFPKLKSPPGIYNPSRIHINSTKTKTIANLCIDCKRKKHHEGVMSQVPCDCYCHTLVMDPNL